MIRNDTKQFICMKWGNLYGPEYVNKLYNMIKKNINTSFRLVCLTDDNKGINYNIECFPCPQIDLPSPYNTKGWRKLITYNLSEYTYNLEGVWLFLDLDVIIIKNLDLFFEYKKERDFIVMKNWTQPNKNIGNTSVYRFKINSLNYLYKKLIDDQDDILIKYPNSQTFISKNIDNITFWPDEWCVLFKVHCVPKWPFRFWKTPFLPNNTHIIAFPGVPNPDQALKGIWPVKNKIKKLYKFIKPTYWINDYWK